MTEIPGPGEWTFNAPEIAASFDKHVREQLPWYDLATGVVVQLARHLLPADGLVLDVGAATGNIGRALEPILDARKARLFSIEPSAEMVAAFHGPGSLRHCDAETYPYDADNPDLIICFLTLMFLRPAARAQTLKAMKDALPPGGGIIVFDKRENEAGEVGTMLSRLTLAAKYEAGAKPEEIIAKELSLAGIQRPLDPYTELGDFTEVFRFGEFSGFVYIKTKYTQTDW
jgi:tRNA (cmo5U34)-methyltransferase